MSKKIFQEKGPTILSILGCTGLITTAVLAVKETPKAIALLEEKDELAMKDKAYIIGTSYFPAISVGAASIACILGANALNKRAQASLISAYSMADQVLKNYRKKNVELYGEEHDKEIMKELARNCGNYHVIGIDSPDAKVSWYEPISGKRFEAYEREIMDAEYHFNRNYILRSCASVNEWLNMLGLPEISTGDNIGWSIDQELYWVDFEHRLVINDDGTEVYYIEPVYHPWENYEE